MPAIPNNFRVPTQIFLGGDIAEWNGMEWLYYPRFDSITQSSQSVSRKRPREVKAPPIVSATEDFFGNSLLSI